eukprot:TRINITY_DN17987_c0_g1_i1.p1 TRINITY_DN17987_c0_g1~~TRINITY_DN17987_c0_g1_i1.p1  ORF type:complete len:320 (+),score=76.25 TRINITY_DN17987_c0_g1_i1:702-1661(+)
MTVKRTVTTVIEDEKPSKAERYAGGVEDGDTGNQLCELFSRILTAPCGDREEVMEEAFEEVEAPVIKPATTDNIDEPRRAQWNGHVPVNPYREGCYVEITCAIQYDSPTTGVVQPGTLAKIKTPPDQGGEMEVVLPDGKEIDVFKEEVLLLDFGKILIAGALVVLRTEAVIASYQSTIKRRLERVRQQVVADFEAALVLRPPGLELLPQKGREEAFRLHVDNTYTSNMKAVLHDKYKKMYGKAYIEIVGPLDPTPMQKKGRKIGAALVAAAAVIVSAELACSDYSHHAPQDAKGHSPRGNRRKRTSRHRRPILAMIPQS